MYPERRESHRHIHGRPSYNSALNESPTVRLPSPICYERYEYKEEMIENSARSPLTLLSKNKGPDFNDVVKNETLTREPQQIKKQSIINTIVKFCRKYTTRNQYWALLAILIFIIFPLDFYSTKHMENDCSNYLQELKSKYRNQDPLFWETIEYGITKTVKQNSRPSVITFLYNDSKSMEIFEAAVELTKKCMSPLTDPIVLSGKELNDKNAQKDYGIIFEKYKSELLKSQIMLVKDLQFISALSSRVFHDFCDMQNPIVIYFTLYYTKEDQESNRNSEELANSLLKKIWSSEIDDNIASPLITRVTDQTLFLKAP